jgi:AsmA family protein
MKPSRHPILTYGALGFAALLVLLVVAVSLLDWDLFRGPIARTASVKSGRTVSIAGHLRVHLWSSTPTVTIEGLRVDNPPWEARRPLLQLQRLLIQVELGQLLRGHLVLRRVELDQPDLYLHQEISGRANWSSTNTQPSSATQPAAKPFNLPAVHELIIQSGKLTLLDDPRRLQVQGTIQADERAAAQEANGFHIKAQGTINQEEFTMDVTGGALLGVDPDHPYPFSVRIKAGQNEIDASGKVLKPFDLGQLELQAAVQGRDLSELYYLTQLALPNTPPYQLRATITRDGQHFGVHDIKGLLGSSDIRGSIDVDASHQRPVLNANLQSNHLLFSDLGALTGTKATADASLNKKVSTSAPPPLAPPAAGPRHLFPDARLQVDRVRAMDADVRFSAVSIESGKVPFKQVNLHVTLKDGVLALDPVRFEMPEGRLSGVINIDARRNVPKVRMDVRATNIKLDQIKGAGPAPVGGVLQARAVIEGRGDSVHDLMSNATGSFVAVIPHGDIRSAFAELLGINVASGIGLLVTKNEDHAAIRCGVAKFDIENGAANAQNIVVDTQNVLITGHGNVNLGTEKLDLSIQGQPKKVTIVRVRSPVNIKGELAKPSFALDKVHVLKQGAIAAALGTLLTPLAAVLAFVDPGLAKDQDCGQLLGQTQTQAQAH